MPVKPVATAGCTFGQWHKRSHSFIFRLPPVSAPFTRTTGIHEFQFRTGFCRAIHIPWEDVDYDYDHNYYLLARERSRLGQGTLEFLTAHFKEGRALQTSTTLPGQPILSGNLYPGSKGGMIQRNIGHQTTDITIPLMPPAPAQCIQVAESGGAIAPLPGLKVSAQTHSNLPLLASPHLWEHHPHPIPFYWEALSSH